MAANPTGDAAQLPLVNLAELHRHWLLFLLLGLLLVALGMAGVVAASVMTLASVLVCGWTLLAAGGMVAAHAFWARRWSGLFVQLVFGSLSLMIGWIMVTRPQVGAVSLALLLGVSLVVQGVMRSVASLSGRVDRRGWLLVSGVTSAALGAMILSQWPLSGAWVIGLFAGVDMLFYGWWLVSLSLSARQLSAAAQG